MGTQVCDNDVHRNDTSCTVRIREVRSQAKGCKCHLATVKAFKKSGMFQIVSIVEDVMENKTVLLAEFALLCIFS